MKYIIFIILLGCINNDCFVNEQIKRIDSQLLIERQIMVKILNQEWSQDIAEQVSEEMDVMESLEIQKLLLQNQKCK